ncbi:Fanconi anemia group F protein [Sorex araneus]|uniref:Fanconi anemia group F protein n=1 Tax=Sorex araneus TaxID=42254 RepID=UPI0024338AA3|nr:Fanconi anemia group F protein [Sorex araneus]
MESLLQHLDRFSEVLQVSRTSHVSTWDAGTVRRALQWARYLRQVHERFGRHAAIRQALEQRLQSRWKREGDPGPAPRSGLPNFQALGRCELLLALNLLENRSLGDAAHRFLLQQLFPGPGPLAEAEDSLQGHLALLARRRAAVHLLLLDGSRLGSPALPDDPLLKTQAQLLLGRLQDVGQAGPQGPRALLCSLWERVSRDNFLKVLATALLLLQHPDPPQEESEESDTPSCPGNWGAELLPWLLGESDALTAFCRQLPAGLLASVAGGHPAFCRAYLALLTEWGGQLHYNLREGAWRGAEASAGSWGELRGRFHSLWQESPSLQREVQATLEACKAQEGDFEVPGLSVWTDLLAALRRGSSHTGV